MNVKNRIRKVAVVAGTPVDTRMGVDFLKANGVSASGYPVNGSPVEQVTFDVQPVEQRMGKLQNIIEGIKMDKNEQIMIYCNSLSSTLDFASLSRKNKIPIVTPMDAYREMAGKFQSLGVVAGSNQALAGIEQAIMRVSADIDIFGASLLPMVAEIEKGEAPDTIINMYGIDHLLKYFEVNKVQAVILGCTHFPYLKDAMERRTELAIVDPAKVIYQLLMSESGV